MRIGDQRMTLPQEIIDYENKVIDKTGIQNWKSCARAWKETHPDSELRLKICQRTGEKVCPYRLGNEACRF